MSPHFFGSRRRFLRNSILGSLGLAQGLHLSGTVRAQNDTLPLAGDPSPFSSAIDVPPARVALTIGDDRADNTFRALRTFEKEIAQAIDLPPGYSITWSGQFEQMLEARKRLAVTIPAVIVTIFVLLMVHFGRLDRTLIIMLSLPFGLIGGLWAVDLAGYDMSVAVAVGFIALGGIAVETAIVMLLYLDHQVRAHPPATHEALVESIMTGAVMRVRPKLMTVLVIIAGLMPIFLTEGLGSDVMRRIALPMVGGMISTTLLTLIVIPVVYLLWEGRRYRPAPPQQEVDAGHRAPAPAE